MVPLYVQLANSTLRGIIRRLHFLLEIMRVCVRWYATYPLSLRHLEKMMAERSVLVRPSAYDAGVKSAHETLETRAVTVEGYAHEESARPTPGAAGTSHQADGSANPQPITSQPLVEIDSKSRKRYVMFGTGQLLDSIDIKSEAAQIFYAFKDGTANTFGTTTGMTRSSLKAMSNSDLVSTMPIDFAESDSNDGVCRR